MTIHHAIRVIAGFFCPALHCARRTGRPALCFQLLAVDCRFCRGQHVPERPDQVVPDGDDTQKGRRAGSLTPLAGKPASAVNSIAL